MIFSVILVKSIVTQAAYIEGKGLGVRVVPGNEGLWQPDRRHGAGAWAES